DEVAESAQAVVDAPASVDIELAPAGPPDSAQAPVEEAPDPYADFVIGAWVELVTNGRVVHTQLTWASPHGTLFLFTAADASTQSMTRRMRDKLAAEGLLRVVPATAMASDAAPAKASRRSEGGASKSAGSSGSRSSKSRG
ncbi:MAG TPA: peptidase, partial [Acidovorax sp.]|nr:peptidase [Acidovorax sp.]